jgi:hypothetical protein
VAMTSRAARGKLRAGNRLARATSKIPQLRLGGRLTTHSHESRSAFATLLLASDAKSKIGSIIVSICAVDSSSTEFVKSRDIWDTY